VSGFARHLSGAILTQSSELMQIATKNKQLLLQTFASMPLPLSKWLYGFARNSIFPDDREPYWTRAFEKVRQMRLSGDYLEFGVYRGTSFILAANSAAKGGLDDMRFFAFDSFAGLPESEGQVFSHGQFACSEDTFTTMITKAGVPIERVVKVKGFYNESLTREVKERYALTRAAIVHIDCDLYSSTKDVLSFIEDLVQPGTIVIFDDWSSFRDEPKPEDFGEAKAFNQWVLRDRFEDFYESEKAKAFIMKRHIE
jgi:O-methyltransferase